MWLEEAECPRCHCVNLDNREYLRHIECEAENMRVDDELRERGWKI